MVGINQRGNKGDDRYYNDRYNKGWGKYDKIYESKRNDYYKDSHFSRDGWHKGKSYDSKYGNGGHKDKYGSKVNHGWDKSKSSDKYSKSKSSDKKSKSGSGKGYEWDKSRSTDKRDGYVYSANKGYNKYDGKYNDKGWGKY
eukprot:336561_1